MENVKEPITIDSIVASYLKLRRAKEAIEAETKAKTAKIKESMTKLEGFIRQEADRQGVTSFKTKHGTAFVTTTDFASVDDWEAALKFILENEAYDMLERRVSKNAVRGYIEANEDVPPGVKYGTKLGVSVRSPAPSAD